MVIIIGGSSHVGKTLLAQKLLEKYKYPYISLDHLKMGFIRTGRTKLTVYDDFEMRYFLWPYAAEIIKTAIENDQNLIVEGCYIPKEWKDSFSEDYLKKIRSVFVVMSESYIRSHAEDIAGYADVIEKRISDQIDVERLVKCSIDFRDDCAQNKTPCLEIDRAYNIEQIAETAEKMIADGGPEFVSL